MLDRSETSSDLIAIVGTACRFPRASTLEEYWNLISSHRNAIVPMPPDRQALIRAYSATRDGTLRRTFSAGFLDNIDGFDAEYFKISAEEASVLDPQQRLVLETAWQALESASLPAARRSEISVGAFIGISGSDHRSILSRSEIPIGSFSGTGALPSMAAGRLSYSFDFHGPCLTVDTSCSSSLAAVHLACKSLNALECDVAIAGGVNIILDSMIDEYLKAIGAVSPSGTCRVFGDKADGYVRGEGCGMIVLRRLSDALRARHSILALVAGSAMNHDGKSNGLTAPNGRAQAAVIRSAIERTGVDSNDVDYIEAHGTGTRLGDPVEVRAIADAFESRKRNRAPLFIGSVKANIGHLEAAAGIAGIIKVVLALRNRVIPPQPSPEKLNPLISWSELRLEVPFGQLPWPAKPGPRYASVSSFGMTGTNVHVILQDYGRSEESYSSVDDSLPIVLSGRSATLVQNFARELAVAIRASNYSLADISYTLTVGRTHLDWRVAFLAATREEMLSHLDEVAGGTLVAKKCLVRPGQLQPVPKDQCANRYLEGCHIDWSQFFGGSQVYSVMLPTTRLGQQIYWFDTNTSVSAVITVDAAALPRRRSDAISAADYLALILRAVEDQLREPPRIVRAFRIISNDQQDPVPQRLEVELRPMGKGLVQVHVIDKSNGSVRARADVLGR